MEIIDAAVVYLLFRLYLLFYCKSNIYFYNPQLLTLTQKHYSILIQGNVKDLANLIPIENVSIEAGEKQKQTKTDKNGNYKIRIYKKDANFIKFSIEGFDSITAEIPKEYEKHEVEINCELPIVNGSTTNIE